jgi:ABC-2 type transport system permease protein
MVVFVYVFGGAITTGSSGLDYIDFVVPAVLLLSAGYGAALTASNVAEDMHGGMIDRLRTLPISSWVVPTSHVIASVVRNVVTAGLALTAAIALGFRPDATAVEWMLVLALVTGYILAMSAIAVVWGLLVKSTQAAEAFSFIVLFLPYLSDDFVPAATMPRLLRGFAEHQPITPLVETVRALLLDQPIGNAGWSRRGGSPWGWRSASRSPPCSSAGERPREPGRGVWSTGLGPGKHATGPPRLRYQSKVGMQGILQPARLPATRSGRSDGAAILMVTLASVDAAPLRSPTWA